MRSPLLYRCAVILVTSCGIALCPCSAACQASGTVSGRNLLLQGRELASQGRLAEAETALLKAEALMPQDLGLLTLLAKVQGRLGEHDQALALFRRIVALGPRVAEAHLDLSIALADAGDLPAALEETSAALALAPRSAAVHLNRARILADLHRIPEARSEFTIASKLQPGNADTLYYWALLERDDHRLAEDSELLERLVKIQPDNDRYFFLLGQSLSEQSRRVESISALRRAVELNPRAGDALYMLAMEVKRDDPEESRALMQRSLQVRDADQVDAVKRLGNEAYAASQRKDWPEAIRLLREAVSACGGCSITAGLHRNLGLTLCQSGDLLEGKKELKITVGVPKDVQSRSLAALSTERLGCPASLITAGAGKQQNMREADQDTAGLQRGFMAFPCHSDDAHAPTRELPHTCSWNGTVPATSHHPHTSRTIWSSNS